LSKKQDRAERNANWVRNHRGVMRLLWRAHSLIYRLSGGRLGGKLGERDILMLTTMGRKSGEPRTTGLYYFRHGDAYVVIASNGGKSADPAWWLNLKSNPHAQAQIGPRRFDVTAEEATGPERDRIWEMARREEPTFATYEQLRDLPIPVVLLRPNR
jgi:F420H(2)-dependent quinone reductase